MTHFHNSQRGRNGVAAIIITVLLIASAVFYYKFLNAQEQGEVPAYLPVIRSEPEPTPEPIVNRVKRYELEGGGKNWTIWKNGTPPPADLAPAFFALSEGWSGSSWEFTGLLYNGEDQEIEPDGPALITFTTRDGRVTRFEGEHVHRGPTKKGRNTCITLIIDDPAEKVGTQWAVNLDSISVDYSYSTSTRRQRQKEIELTTEIMSTRPNRFRHTPNELVTDVFGYELSVEDGGLTYRCRSHHKLGYNSSDPFINATKNTTAWQDR